MILQRPLPVRLSGGKDVHEGRVEIQVGYEWGTICDDTWDLTDARVVCKMLGYQRAVRALQGAHFGPGTGPIFIDDLTCTGTEPTIEVCKHKGLRSHDCDHSKDAGVTCHRGNYSNFIILMITTV